MSDKAFTIVEKESVICPHEKLQYIRTYEDWWDGDEEDIYKCLDCGKEVRKYIPR